MADTLFLDYKLKIALEDLGLEVHNKKELSNFLVQLLREYLRIF